VSARGSIAHGDLHSGRWQSTRRRPRRSPAVGPGRRVPSCGWPASPTGRCCLRSPCCRSAGVIFPAPVKLVEIPKPGGKGVRILGVATIAGQGGADGGQNVSGTEGRADRPSGLLWLSPGPGWRWMRWGHVGNAVGERTGSLTWTSRNSSCHMTLSSRR
jgi:hypothetical protein